MRRSLEDIDRYCPRYQLSFYMGCTCGLEEGLRRSKTDLEATYLFVLVVEPCILPPGLIYTILTNVPTVLAR